MSALTRFARMQQALDTQIDDDSAAPTIIDVSQETEYHSPEEVEARVQAMNMMTFEQYIAAQATEAEEGDDHKEKNKSEREGLGSSRCGGSCDRNS